MAFDASSLQQIHFSHFSSNIEYVNKSVTNASDDQHKFSHCLTTVCCKLFIFICVLVNFTANDVKYKGFFLTVTTEEEKH